VRQGEAGGRFDKGVRKDIVDQNAFPLRIEL
jgi:hypothetical protein